MSRTLAAPLPQPAGDPRLLTKRHFARSLGVSERTVDSWRARGAVQAVKLGPKVVRFHPDELARVMREGVSS